MKDKTAGPRGGLYYHPVMTRLAATEYEQLSWLARRKQQGRGELVRQMITDNLADLMALGTPLRTAYDREHSARRRSTPVETAVKRAERQARLAAAESPTRITAPGTGEPGVAVVLPWRLAPEETPKT